MTTNAQLDRLVNFLKSGSTKSPAEGVPLIFASVSEASDLFGMPEDLLLSNDCVDYIGCSAVAIYPSGARP